MNPFPVVFSGRRRVAPLLFALATLLLTLTGCNTTGRGGGPQNAPADALRIMASGDPGSFDPAVLTDLPTYEILENCCESLVRINAQNQPEPALAEKWDISPDGKAYTFHLRKGVTFHNGSPMTSADVKYSWERALSPKTKSPSAVNYLDGVIGAAELTKGKRADLSGVKVVDDSTLTVTLDHPRAFFPGMVAYPTNSILCKAEVEASGGVVNEKNLAKIGTGAFIFEAYTPGQSVTFKANPNYWGGPPKLKGLTYTIIVDPSTAYDGFRTGKLDFFEAPVQRYVQDKTNAQMASQYHLSPSASVSYLVMQRVNQPAFAKLEVRKAFALAIDREKILSVALQGVMERADGFTPPQLLNGQPAPPAIPYDPAQAKRLMAQAGYPDGKGFPTLTLNYIKGSPAATNTATMIQDSLKNNLGVLVNLQEREQGQFFKDESAERMSFYTIAWIADYPDAQDFLSTLLVTGASQNHSKYSNPKLDALCQQADIETDAAKRAALYAAADKILMEDVGVLPLSFTRRVFLVKSNVQGWRANVCSRLPETFTTK